MARISEPIVQGLAADSSAEATAGPSHADGLPGADVDPNPDAADPDTGIVHSTSARALSAPTRESLREASNALTRAQTSVAPVHKAMRDAAGTLRSLAADTAAHADQRAEVLAKMLRTDSSAEVRRVAAWGLHNYGDIRVAVDALVAALAGDASADVREMAAWSLAEAEESSAAAGALTKALRQDKDASVRRTATWALGEVGDASAVEALAGLLTDANAETREVAAWSIGSCEPSKAPAALLTALGDRDRDVRLSTAWALYNIGDSDATAAIEAAYKRETDAEVRIGLIRALGAMGDRAVDVAPAAGHLVRYRGPRHRGRRARGRRRLRTLALAPPRASTVP